MMYAVLVLLGLLICAAAVIYVMAARRITKAALGEPTPDTAKIETEILTQTDAIKENGEKLKSEVANANGETLLRRVRDRLVRGMRH